MPGETLSGPLYRALRRAAAEASLAPGDVAVVYGAADGGQLAALLADRQPAATVVVAAHDVRAATAAGARSGVRVEVVQRLAEVGVEAPPRLVAIVPGGYEGKERLREMVAEAAAALAPGGVLLLVSHARRGAGTLLRMAEEAFGAAEVVGRGGGGMRVMRAVHGEGGDGAAGGAVAVAAPDVEIEAEVLGRTFRFATGPGVFSRERLDPGTRLLIEAVAPTAAPAVLDLGCGYGPIGVAVAALSPSSRVTLADVDARAVGLARANCELNGVSGQAEAVVADGPAALGRSFDLILSHFPLHAPRGDRDRLVREARAALEPRGRLCVVVLAQYDLTSELERAFARVERVADTLDRPYPSERYVVLQARRGR